MKSSLFLSIATVMVGCTIGDAPPKRGDEDAALVLHDDALATELSTSPAHNTATIFERVGIMFDSDRPTAIEIATSRDGAAWSAWHAVELRHVEGEATSAFVGEVAVDNGQASYFKLRGAAGKATYARVDVLETMGAEWEGGDANSTAELAPGAPSLPGVTVHARAEWGARAATCTGTHTPKMMTIHMSDTPSEDKVSVPARIRQIQSYHRDVRGWCDIGYHFIVSPDGQIWEGRPITKIGAHSANANTNNVGIVLLGTFNTAPPTDKALAATSALIGAIGSQYKIALSRTTVKGHREVGTTETDCPGSKTFALLGSIVERAKGNPPSPPPPATTGSIDGIVYRGADPSDRLAGATVTIEGKSAVTSSTGYYTIAGISPGPHVVAVTKAGFRSISITRDTGVDTFIGIGLDAVAATGTAGVQGVVYRGTDGLDRVANARVTLSTGQTLTADAHGYFLVTSLPSGEVTITAEAPGFTARSVTRTLTSGTTEWGSVSLH